MDSLKELYKIGNGPSSSHTMGPQKAAKIFRDKNPNAEFFKVELYGSLAATGKGHLTDWVIIETLKPKACEIIWKPQVIKEFHTNGMMFQAFDKEENLLETWEVYSVGGGSIMEASESRIGRSEIYPLTKLEDIIKWCKDNCKELWEYVEEYEDKDIWAYLMKIWHSMEKTIDIGLSKTGVLPGTLKYPRKAQMFYKKARREGSRLKNTGLTFAYALAVSEENGGGGIVVTAPTCGACGVVPAVLRSIKEELSLDEEEILKGLAIGGLIGNLIKENASISGAEVGCQGEVGAACSMAAAIATYFYGGTLRQIEYAAEMALEHHLGMTCDPVGGYVQVPCIERNAVAAERALSAANYSLFTDGSHRVSFDEVVITMMETGKDLKCAYRETSEGGLAKNYKIRD
ncbi:MAG: L-serine ammonia-lyase [Fusobacteriaceae bacterium]|nr:L-serine ammonia-lyase [Fusobacteriaceae bacterium]MBP6468620.1 L-serine ammonia-lyase [Fusobacteriaceae bacterium]